jgi:hypothetical protein
VLMSSKRYRGLALCNYDSVAAMLYCGGAVSAASSRCTAK